MMYQITIDDNNNVIGFSMGDGIIPDGITVDVIPQKVQENYRTYKYIDGVFVFNPDFIQTDNQEQNASPQPTITDLQTEVTALKEQNALLESCVMQLADSVFAV